MFKRSENYNKKRRSKGIDLFIQISPSEFLRPFFETLLRFQIRRNKSSSEAYYGFDWRILYKRYSDCIFIEMEFAKNCNFCIA
jgi:hypothetical protein